MRTKIRIKTIGTKVAPPRSVLLLAEIVKSLLEIVEMWIEIVEYKPYVW